MNLFHAITSLLQTRPERDKDKRVKGTKGQRDKRTKGQKKSRNLSGQQKIMQPHGTKKKSHNLLGRTKACNLFGQKKIMQPLGTKKNHATSQKKSHNL